MDTEHAAADGPDFSTEEEEEGYGDELYPRGAVLPGVDYQVVGGQRDEQSYAGGDQNNTREHVQVSGVIFVLYYGPDDVTLFFFYFLKVKNLEKLTAHMQNIVGMY